MFTGIIEELGRVRSLERRGEGVRMTVEARVVTEGTGEGDSIAVNGVCLTALDVKPDGFTADVSQETLDRSTLGKLKNGAKVNLEADVIAKYVERILLYGRKDGGENITMEKLSKLGFVK